MAGVRYRLVVAEKRVESSLTAGSQGLGLMRILLSWRKPAAGDAEPTHDFEVDSGLVLRITQRGVREPAGQPSPEDPA